MKNELKISTLSIVCVLCVSAFPGAYGAASVRSLGGTGTYTSASSAASAGTSGAMRGGSVRVTPTTGKTTTATTSSGASTTAGRVATTPRLSIGKYLPGGSSVSGGSSIKYPSGGGSSSSGGSMDPDSAAALKQDINELRQDVSELQAADRDWADALDSKQNIVSGGRDGYIIVENDEIFVDTVGLADALKDQGLVGDVDFRVSNGEIQWSQGGDAWTGLIAIEDLTGVAGEKGEKGDKGDPGETGPMGPQGPAGTIDTDAMNAAIDTAIANKDWSEFAKVADLTPYAKSADVNYALGAKANVGDVYTKAESDAKYLTEHQSLAGLATVEQLGAKADKSELNGYATTEQLNQKANAADVYTKAQTDTAITEAVEGVVAGDLSNALKDYAKTADVQTLVEGKADKTVVDTLSGTVTTLDGQIGTIADTVATVSDVADAAQADATAANNAAVAAQTTANAAATDAATALSSLGNVYTKTESDAKYATQADLDGKLDSGALTGYAKTADIEATYETQAHATATYATKDEIPSLDGYAKSADVYTAEQTNNLLNAKQNALTFDAAPTAGSTNPVTSGGVAQAIADAQLGGEVDLTGYATEQYVQDYVNMPTATGSYMLTVNGGQKEWAEIKIVE